MKNGSVASILRRPNPRLQRTRLRAPLSRKPLGGLAARRLARFGALSTLGFCLLAAINCRNRYFVMPSTGMEPTIKRGARFATEPVEDADRANIRRGEIVVFRLPGKPGDLQVRRVVAVGGDRVEIKSKHLLVNGSEPTERYVTHTDPIVFEGAATSMNWARDQMPVVKVPTGAVFLLGDNRDNSLDSRFFGVVKVEDVVGRVNEPR
jgi:signal peptidase I